jgi:uncharacterized integral membrane protein
MNEDASNSRRFGPAFVVVGVLVALLAAFALANLDDVEVDFVVASATPPLIAVIALCALLGFVIGWFVGRHRD